MIKTALCSASSGLIVAGITNATKKGWGVWNYYGGNSNQVMSLLQN